VTGASDAKPIPDVPRRLDKPLVNCTAPISDSELTAALRLLLAASGDPSPASATQVATFFEYLQVARIGWAGHCVRREGVLRGLAFAMLLPGRTAMVMYPQPGEFGIDAGDQDAALAALMSDLDCRALRFTQVLLEAADEARRELALRHGFRRLTRLIYLERDARDPGVEAPRPDGGRWVSFTPERFELFARTVEATYVDSLDCPELSGLRPVQEAILAHQAAGRFTPELWEVLEIDGQPVACLLLAPHLGGATLELVYMGVCPARRRCGVGALLLRRALQRCRERGARHLTLVVDERNLPARKLYERFGFRTLALREAYLRRG